MTDITDIDNPGTLVVAAIRAKLDGDTATEEQLLDGQPHEVWAAVLLATSLARCLNKLDPGDADEHLMRYGLQFTGEPPHGTDHE